MHNQYTSHLQKEGKLFEYFMISLWPVEKKKQNEVKFDMNYLVVIVLICEFCNKFIYSTYDVIVSQYGIEKHQLSSLEFGYSFTHSLIH